MCVSPYPHINKSPTNTCLYWIGPYADVKFDLQRAKGANLASPDESASAHLLPWSQESQVLTLHWLPGRALLFTCKGMVGAGPFPLDLGDSLYAPNCFRDGSGRRLMLGWFQELGARGPASECTYSGCLTLPRVLSRRGAASWPCWPTMHLRHMPAACVTWRLNWSPAWPCALAVLS